MKLHDVCLSISKRAELPKLKAKAIFNKQIGWKSWQKSGKVIKDKLKGGRSKGQVQYTDDDIKAAIHLSEGQSSAGFKADGTFKNTVWQEWQSEGGLWE